MPNCRNCGVRISRFNKDLCPICGTKTPLDGVSSDTMEITAQVDLSGIKEGQRILRHRKPVLLLFALVGFSGAPFFYLKQKSKALMWLAINLFAIAAFFLIFYYLLQAGLLSSIFLTIAVLYIFNITTGIVYFLIPNLKDGEGEFVN